MSYKFSFFAEINAESRDEAWDMIFGYNGHKGFAIPNGFRESTLFLSKSDKWETPDDTTEALTESVLEDMSNEFLDDE
jgi:hypothetical protein|tara:strand:- start:86 stop:319 length:234 start_codon:yes stop_codon:yes gene_type:complete